MTADKDFKKLIRSRMEKTGESYAAARASLLRSSEPSTQSTETDPPPTEEERRILQEAAERGVRMIHERSGRWAARANHYPHLVEYGETAMEARRLLLDDIHEEDMQEGDWRNAISDPVMLEWMLLDDI